VKISIIDPTIDSRWDEFVARHEKGTIFHTSAWAAVIKEAYNYLPSYYVLEDEAGQFIAGIPLYLVRSRLTGVRFICLPFSDYCYPLGNDSADITLLLNSVKEKIKAGAASYLEIRGWQNRAIPPQSEMVTREYNLRHILDLEPSADILKERFHHSVRRGIHQAEKRGVTVRMTHTEADLHHFFELNVATHKKLGVLPQPHAFFKALYRHVISQDLGFLAMAEWDGKVIAGVLFLKYKDTIYYKFNASVKNYLQKRPNHLIIWEAIRYTCANGYKYFDFGRCPFEEEGLRTFKCRWGSQEINLPYYYYPKAKGLSTISENSLIFRSMKVFLHATPHFACKIAGSLLYRHLA
jgi:lipid II:glycine glycyltransferase (peptidoglycan interpeptide bridge formation enzyme)